MKNTLLTLRKPIPNNIREILRTVSDVRQELKLNSFVIGATARDIIFEFVYKSKITRATQDVDFGIAIGSWPEYRELKATLVETGKFEAGEKNRHRAIWISEGGKMGVDLVPFGGIESPKGRVSGDDFEMSTIGLEIVSDDCWSIQIDDDRIANIASLRGLVLLKFVSYNDRPAERQKDLQDIWFIARNYQDAGNEDRVYGSDGDLLDEDTFDNRTIGARLLGRDLAELIDAESREIVLRPITENAAGGRIEEFADLIAGAGIRGESARALILSTLRELRKGIVERLKA